MGFSGSAGFGYRLKDIGIDLSLSQGIDPSATGQLQSFSRIGGGFTWDITEDETLALTTNLSYRSPFSGGGSTLGTLTTGATYSLALTREARLSLGYTFRASDDSVTGFASGHQLFVTLSHDFTFLP